MRPSLRTYARFAAAFIIFAAGRAFAGCCAHCGCQCECRKVCRLVCEEKKVEVICWGCQCEDFCVPGRSCQGCKHCECVCGDCNDECDCKKPHAKPKLFVWKEWSPSCAKILTKTK